MYTVVRRLMIIATRYTLAIALALLVLPLSVPVHAANESVNIWLTTPDQTNLLAAQPPLAFAPDSSSLPTTINVDETNTYQQWDGAGASLTDSSAWLIATKLTPAQRATLLTNLFDPIKGIGLNLLRQPMGASDFTLSGSYSYDDMPSGQTDPTLAHFSIAHDLAYIIPELKAALIINPALRIIATPWSPPGWMKATGTMMGGTLLPSAYGPWAQYFVKFIQAYMAQGLPIYAVTPQNEPLLASPIAPSLSMSSTDEAALVHAYLGPALAAAGLSTKILIYDFRWNNVYPVTVLADAGAAPFIAGSAFHCYGGTPDFQTLVHDSFPNKDIYETECSSGLWWPTDFARGLRFDMHTLIIGATRNWGQSVIKWNIALDQNHGPSQVCPNCQGLATINTATGALSYNEDYFALGHLSKFVQRGAYRIGSNTFGATSIEDVAFRNPDGSKVLIAFNGGASGATFKVQWGTQAFTYTLPAGAAATFTWAGIPNPLTYSAFRSLEAEFAALQPGVVIEPCQEVGGGYDTSFSDTAGTLMYPAVNFGAGASRVQARIATTAEGGQIDLHLDAATGPLVGTIPLPLTGGAQTWVTVTAPVSGAVGMHALYALYHGVVSGSAHLNWLTFDRAATSTIKAAGADTMYGGRLESTTDVGGGLDVGNTTDGAYLLFKNVDFGSGVTKVQARIASPSAGGTIEFRLQSLLGPLIGSMAVTNTGGWQAWTTTSIPISGTSGVSNLYVVFRGPSQGIASLNWLAFG